MRTFRGDPCAPLRRELEALFRKHKLTPAAAERAARMSVGSIQYFMSGKVRTPDLVTACLMARAFAGGSLDGIVPVDEICELYDRESMPALKLSKKAARR